MYEEMSKWLQVGGFRIDENKVTVPTTSQLNKHTYTVNVSNIILPQETILTTQQITGNS